MRVQSLPSVVTDIWSGAVARSSKALTPTVRLGVTGLARAGKTVFITSLVRNLTAGGRLPFFAAAAEGRIVSAHLEPQPDDSVPRFDYETHMKALAADPPSWPDSTRRISELRLVIEYEPTGLMRRVTSATRRLNVDIVDYPGEWLLDLALLDKSFAAWSEEALGSVRAPERAEMAAPFLGFLASLDGTADPEQVAIEGAKLYTAYLAAHRQATALTTMGPGRFLMPGDLEGAPLVTFFPLDQAAIGGRGSGALMTLLAQRYQSYVQQVVVPFFRDHFLRLDRQIVLVDVLGALNGGASSVKDLETSLTAVLSAFRPGRTGLFASLFGRRRIDRVLFAATKADHVHQASHGRLEAILRLLAERASQRTEAAGARVEVAAIAAVRATREGDVADGRTGEALPCIFGVPLAGEVVAGRRFDGRQEFAVFPGDLPADPAHVLTGLSEPVAVFPRFRPPLLKEDPARARQAPLPHIRLDRALQFLIGDRLQ